MTATIYFACSPGDAYEPLLPSVLANQPVLALGRLPDKVYEDGEGSGRTSLSSGSSQKLGTSSNSSYRNLKLRFRATDSFASWNPKTVGSDPDPFFPRFSRAIL
jgi:hypothetical protein